MEAQQVIDKIISEAKAQAQQIKNEARQKADAERRALEQELDDFRQETDKQAREAAEDKIERMKARTRMEVRKAFLAAKVALLNDVFAKARTRIREMNDESYRELMANLMVKAVRTGDEEVLVGANDHRIDQNLIKQVNRRLVNGYKGNLNLSNEKADIEAGFILRRGSVLVNASGQVLVEMIRDRIEGEIARELFGASTNQ